MLRVGVLLLLAVPLTIFLALPLPAQTASSAPAPAGGDTSVQVGPEGAGPEGGGPATLEDLQRRVAELEAQQAELKKQVAALPPAGAKTEAGKQSVWSTVEIALYGYIKFDAAYDTARMDQGNYARWVESEATNEDDSEFNMTANQTRLGLRFKGPDLGSVKPGALLEMDFYGGGTDNKPNPMLRKAYLEVDWTDLDLKLLAGQDSDTMSPLFPDTINYTVQWWAGNIGYRRPQLRLTKGFGLGGTTRLELAAAAARTIGRSTTFGGVKTDPGDTGEDAGFPAAQGRVALTFPFGGSSPGTIGFSGHWGEEELDTDATDDHVLLDSWSANVDFQFPITPWLRLKGEGFLGQLLDAYLGGIGQGVTITVDPVTGAYVNSEEIYSLGGWVMVNLGPFRSWNINLGTNAEKVRESDVVDGARTLNFTYFGNVLYTMYQVVQAGVEIGWWDTEYKNKQDGDALRVQATMIFKF